MNGIESVGIRSASPPPEEEHAAGGALRGDFGDLDILMIQSAEAQRRAGEAIRRANRAERRRMVEAAARAIENAALWQLASAVSGSIVSIGTAALPPLMDLPRPATMLLQALDAAWSKLNPCDLAAAFENASGKRRELAATEAGEAAQTGQDLIAAARDIERRMIDRLSELERTGAESRRAALSRR